jgi:hypothetical protein
MRTAGTGLRRRTVGREWQCRPTRHSSCRCAHQFVQLLRPALRARRAFVATDKQFQRLVTVFAVVFKERHRAIQSILAVNCVFSIPDSGTYINLRSTGPIALTPRTPRFDGRQKMLRG